MTSPGKIYGEALVRGNGKGKDPEEALSLSGFTNSKKACVANAGGEPWGVRGRSMRQMTLGRKEGQVTWILF